MCYLSLCYFVTINLRFKVCDSFPDMVQKSMSFINDAIVIAERNNYRINFWCMKKGEAVNKIKNSDFCGKSRQT